MLCTDTCRDDGHGLVLCQNVQSIDCGPHLESGRVGEPVSLPSSVATESEVTPSTPMLPPPVPMAVPQFTWGDGGVNSETFTTSLRTVYTEVMHWKRNIFSVPSGSVGKAFVNEIAQTVPCLC